MNWQRLTNNGKGDDPFYGVMRLVGDGVSALREMFPDGKADDLNFVLFSTSGIHGTYLTIEEAEEAGGDVTFLVVHPRIVGLKYGNCKPGSPEDFAFLKRLRASSMEAVQSIGTVAMESST